jgi:hypothetical protein
MNDIYEQKAKKYKYKYLKLKGGFLKFNNHLEFIGKGTYGCIISPPFQTKKMKLNNLNYETKDYVGKLLSCDNNVFNNEHDEFMNLDTIDPEAKYRSKLIYSEYTSKQELITTLRYTLSRYIQYTQIYQLYYCLSERIFNNKNNNYGYIISTRVGTSFKDHNLNIFNKEEIKIILKNLKKSIEDLIQKLYDDESIHGDIKLANMTLDDNLNIYFIDFGFMTKYNIEKNINNKSKNHQYPDILNIFLNIKNDYKTKLIELLYTKYKKNKYIEQNNLIELLNYNFKYIEQNNLIELLNTEYDKIKYIFEDKTVLNTDKNNYFDKTKLIKLLKTEYDKIIFMNKSELIKLLNTKDYQKSLNYSIQIELLEIINLKSIDYSHFFQSIDDKKYNLKDFYIKCIEPIAKNIDIYALSLFIYQLFFYIFVNYTNFNYEFINDDIIKILDDLLKNALYNNIDGPKELIKYLDRIIDKLDA